jgi:hypothetical protein
MEYINELNKYRKEVNNVNAELPAYRKYFKFALSLIVSLFMVSLL